MTYLYLLAGENLELAGAELRGFLESQGEEEKIRRQGRLAETAAEPDQLKRLALTHEVSRKVCEKEEGEETGIECGTSFAVRAENISEREIDTSRVEKELGAEIERENKEAEVDLENPEKVFRAYILEEKTVIGERILDINRGLFEKRRNQERPFSSPVSLDPVLSRVLVNLSGVKHGKNILDPFCGTGGVLIEAGLCGVGVHGLDIKKEMKKGAEENLEACGIINHDIRQGDISQVDEIFENGFDAVVTDLPYGQASKEVGTPVEKFLEFIDGLEIPVVFMWNEEELGDHTADFSVYVHKNLTRHIFVV